MVTEEVFYHMMLNGFISVHTVFNGGQMKDSKKVIKCQKNSLKNMCIALSKCLVCICASGGEYYTQFILFWGELFL